MAIYKNVASQKLAVFAYDSTDGSPKTGDAANITAQISLNGGATSATNDVNPTELDATDAPGIYIFDLTQAETNADLIIVAAVSSTANIEMDPVIIYTTPGSNAAILADAVRLSGDSVAADNAEAFFDGTGYAGTNNTIPTVTNLTNLPTIPNNWLTAAGIADGAFTAAKFASGAFDAVWTVTTRALSTTGVAAIAAGVWDELTSAIRVVGSYGERIANNLNATVSSRASEANATTNYNNLANLITALNNLSAKMNIFGAPLLEIPDSGSTVYAFTVVVKDDEDKLVNLDASPTLAAANAAATDRSANLSAVSNPSTGRYTFTYTVANTHAKESLRITVSGTVSAEARYIEWIGAVVDYDTLTTLQDVQTRVIDLQTQVGTDGAGLTAIGDTRLANLDATVSSRASATALTTVEGKVDSLLARITTNLFTGITSLADWLRRGFRKDSGSAGMIAAEAEINTGGTATFLGTTDSLEAIRDRGDAAWTGGGGGGGGDPWSTELPASYVAGQAGFILNAMNNSISGGKITSVSPVTVDGQLSGPIIIGDDYLAADSRSFDWFIDPPSGSIGDYSCRFGGTSKGASGWLVSGVLAAVTVDGNPKWRMRYELPKAKTESLEPRLYSYSAELRKSGSEVTKFIGTVQALRRYTDGTIS